MLRGCWMAVLLLVGAAATITTANPYYTEENIDVKATDLHRRVIGGAEVETGTWPWLVSLKAKVPDKEIFGIALSHKKVYCTASLLSDRWVLTAAHCFDTGRVGAGARVARNWHARIGDMDIDNSIVEDLQGLIGNALDFDDWRTFNIHAEEIIIHAEYDPADRYANDIALLRLSESVPIGSEEFPEIDSVLLPVEEGMENFPAPETECIMKGWGCLSDGGPVSSVAHQTSLPALSDEQCYRYWRVDTDIQLCAGYNMGSTGMCSGDSGGPLVCRDVTGRWVQAGVASFASASNPERYPGVFAKVTAYIPWIYQHVDQQGR